MSIMISSRLLRRQLRLYSSVAEHTRPTSIAFIGLGRMGFEMAYNLFSKTYNHSSDAQFFICDAVPECTKTFSDTFLKQFPQASLQIARTPEEAVLGSRIIITMLPSSPQVRTVYLESGGILPALKALPESLAQNTLCIDSTTLDVNVARSVAIDVAKTGAQMVDAPVSGGATGAKAGTLSFLVGGTDQAFQIASGTLAHMGKRIIHCGPSGAGLGAKICNNLILGVQQVVVAEAMILGQKLGLDPTTLSSVINSSTGACWASSVNNPAPSALPGLSPPCERDYEGGFATALMLKDMSLASHLAKDFGSPLPLGEAAEAIYAKVTQETPDLARKDFSSVYLYFKRVAMEGRNAP